MKALARNKQKLHYALYSAHAEVYDEDGLFTGEYTEGYSEPVEIKMNISPANGRTALDAFGIVSNYDKVLVTTDMDCPIAEDSILWIGADPTQNPHNYIVSRVARSLNSIVYGVTEVSVSA